jgi:hypothetical protein
MECVSMGISLQLSSLTDSWQAGVLLSCYNSCTLGPGMGLRRSMKIERVSRDIPWDELGVTTTLVFLNTTHLTRKEHQHAWLAGSGQRSSL